MLKLILAITLLVLPAFAQQPDLLTLQKAAAVLQIQRDRAINDHANAEIRAALLADEIIALKARIAELEKKEKSDAK